MSTVAWKKTTDLIVNNVREQMLRLKTYYRCMGSCWDCKRRLSFYDYDDASRDTGWRVARLDPDAPHSVIVHEAKTVPVCLGCHQKRLAA